MAESIIVDKSAARSDQYAEIIPQIKALIEDEPDRIANLANTCAALKTAMDFFWVGFYLVKDDELVLGPFQGTVACTRIGFGKGVCGVAWAQRVTQVVDDVDQFPGHIACSSESRSEIVIPILSAGQVVALLDIDSDRHNNFSEIDRHWLEQLAESLGDMWNMYSTKNKN